MTVKEKTVGQAIKTGGWIIVASTLMFPAMLIFLSLPLLNENSILQILSGEWDTENKLYGILPFIATSFFIASVSTLISFVFGFGISLFSYHYKKKIFGKILSKVIQYMTGVPTVVYGFAGIFILVPLVRKYTESSSGYCLLTIFLILAVLILPTIVLYINESFSLVNSKMLTAAQSLGATKEQLYLYILIPKSIRGIVVALILGFSRAISDTMIPLMLSGNALQFPESFYMSARSLTAHIAMVLPGEYDGIEFRVIFFIALLLMLIVLLYNIIINYLEKRSEGH